MPKIKSYYKNKHKGFWAKARVFFARKKQKGPKRKFIRKIKIILMVAAWLILLIFIGTIGIFAYYAKDLPNPNQIASRSIIQSTKIYDRTGEVLLYDVHGEEKRTVIPFKEIPRHMKEATLVIEDDEFYHHFGLNFKGIARSLIYNFLGKETLGRKVSTGGSTITQQFIKNAILTPEKTLIRKIKEAILAIEMEVKYSKDEILGFYLNQVPYGSNAYGVEAATQTFFNKSAKDLTIAESALLASLTQAPSYYSRYGSHFETTKARQEYILERMYQFGYINKEELQQAKEEQLKFNPVTSEIKAPHFIMFIKEYLEEKYGKEYIEKAGLEVYTTLDWDLQQIAEELVAEGVAKNIKNHNSHNAALVAVDPKNGQLLTMVGSKDYFAPASPGGCLPGTTGRNSCLFEPNVNVTTRLRQPGSSFKPLAYAAAFSKGFTPETIIFDLETNFATNNSPDYIPQNYDEKFRGPVTFREGLAQSLNIPSVKVLYLAGIDKTINTAQDMGIESLKDRSRYGLSLVLGGGEVRLLEETAAFGVFANDGVKNPLSFILKIKNSKGEVLEEYNQQNKRVLAPQTARLISNILSDEETRSSMFGEKSALYVKNIPVAAKTGTTQEYRDGWTIGYTPSLVVGVWAGNNNNASMRRGAGVYVAAPIWNKFITMAYQLKIKNQKSKIKNINNYFNLPEEVEEFPQPEPVETEKDILNGKFANETIIKIDKISNKLATNLTPPNLIEERTYKQIHCILYYIDKNNPQGEENGKSDPQFLNWEKSVLNWVEKEGFLNQQPPTEYDDIHVPENQPEINIISPEEDGLIKNDIIIKTEINAPLGIQRVEFFLDEKLIGNKNQEPYYFQYKIPSSLGIEEGGHIIKVKAYDNAWNNSIKQVRIFIES